MDMTITEFASGKLEQSTGNKYEQENAIDAVFELLPEIGSDILETQNAVD